MYLHTWLVHASCSHDGLNNPYTCIRWMTSEIGYLKLLITQSILSCPLEFEIKRVACNYNSSCESKLNQCGMEELICISVINMNLKLTSLCYGKLWFRCFNAFPVNAGHFLCGFVEPFFLRTRLFTAHFQFASCTIFSLHKSIKQVQENLMQASLLATSNLMRVHFWNLAVQVTLGQHI